MGLTLAAVAAAGTVGYRLVVTGELTLDTGVGRTLRPLGPLTATIAAPRDTVFDVIAASVSLAGGPFGLRGATSLAPPRSWPSSADAG